MFTETTVGCKRISGDNEFSLVHCLLKADKPSPPSVQPGTYVVVRVAGRRYVGFLSDINIEDGEADVSLLRPNLPTEVLTWPADLNTLTVPLPHVLCTVTLSEQADNKYKFTEEDIDLLLKLRILRGKKK